MTLAIVVIGGIVIINVFALISSHFEKKAREAEAERKRIHEEKLRQAELAREAIPCKLCELIPNRKLHDCVVKVEVSKEQISGKQRYRDTLIHNQGKLRKCDKTHPSEVEALKCGNLALRNSQIGDVKIFMSSVQTPSKADVQTPRTSVSGLDADSWAALVLQYNFKCVYCGVAGDASTFHREHKIPLARGGENHISNIVPACAACNLDKKILTDEEYRTLRRERAEFLETNPDDAIPGNALRPKVDSLPKDESTIPAPRVSVKVGTFFQPWIEAVNRLAAWDSAHVVEAYSRAITDPKKKPISFSFNVRRDKEEHWLTNGERAIYTTFHPNPKPRPKNYRANMLYERLTFMCGLSQLELEGLNKAIEIRKDMWIWGRSNVPIGLIKVEKLVWRDDGSDAMLFHLYRIPRGEQSTVKVKSVHKPSG